MIDHPSNSPDLPFVSRLPGVGWLQWAISVESVGSVLLLSPLVRPRIFLLLPVEIDSRRNEEDRGSSGNLDRRLSNVTVYLGSGVCDRPSMDLTGSPLCLPSTWRRLATLGYIHRVPWVRFHHSVSRITPHAIVLPLEIYSRRNSKGRDRIRVGISKDVAGVDSPSSISRVTHPSYPSYPSSFQSRSILDGTRMIEGRARISERPSSRDLFSTE